MNSCARSGFRLRLAAMAAVATNGRPAADLRIAPPPPPPNLILEAAPRASTILALLGASPERRSPVRYPSAGLWLVPLLSFSLLTIGGFAQGVEPQGLGEDARAVLGNVAIKVQGHPSAVVASQSEDGLNIRKVPLFLSASDSLREGFVRIINHSGESGEVNIEAKDETGRSFGPALLSLGANQAAHFNSEDLERGNPAKGLSPGVGGGQGDWWLRLETTLDIEALAYVRTRDGFLAGMSEFVLVPGDQSFRTVALLFNPASNRQQVSKLRLVNLSEADAEVEVTGVDQTGRAAPRVYLTLPALGGLTLTAQQLEEGGSGLSGRFGDGSGKWRLNLTADQDIYAMNLLESPTGHLANLTPVDGIGALVGFSGAVPLFAPASHSFQQGFVGVTNVTDASREVGVLAVDDSGRRFGPATFPVDAWATIYFNSEDLETGNADLGNRGVGTGRGDWRLLMGLESTVTEPPPAALPYVRTVDGFVTGMWGVAPESGGRHWVPFFNPGSNDRQMSKLRLLNSGDAGAEITVSGVDDQGRAALGGDVRLSLPAGQSRILTARELERGISGLRGRLGDGSGKWRLVVTSEQPIKVMSLLESPTGHLSNLSTSTKGNGGQPITINGVVENFYTGSVIPNATVAIRQYESGVSKTLATVYSDTQGRYAAQVAAMPGRVSLTVTAQNFAQQSKVVQVTESLENISTRLPMIPVQAELRFPSRDGAQMSVEGQTVVSIEGNSLVTPRGNIATGEVTAKISVLDASANTEVMPGDFSSMNPNTEVSEPIESFGAMNVTFVDRDGVSLNLGEGREAEISIPLAGRIDPRSAPQMMPMYYWSDAMGYWIREGEALLQENSAGQYAYVGTVGHFSTWNADKVFETTNISGCITDLNGRPIANARVSASGQNYIGRSDTTSDQQGRFNIAVRRNSEVLLTAIAATQSNTHVVSVGSNQTDLPQCLAVGPSAATIKLTWGENPRDLDSHLWGPDGEDGAFHVYYGNRDEVVAESVVALDVDDTSSYGPEVITITSFPSPGQYQYYVHHYSGSSDILNSPARVELNLEGRVFTFSPSSAAGEVTRNWAVFDIEVDEALRANMVTVQEWRDRIGPLLFANSKVGSAGSFSRKSPLIRQRVGNPMQLLVEKKYYAK